VALAERARLDVAKTEQIRKERDELPQTVVGTPSMIWPARSVPMPISGSTISWASLTRRGS
jgi:hypothetical protein